MLEPEVMILFQYSVVLFDIFPWLLAGAEGDLHRDQIPGIQHSIWHMTTIAALNTQSDTVTKYREI